MLGLGLGLTSPASIGGVAAPVVPPWVPTDLGSKLKGWLKADTLSNGAVASWTDAISGAAIVQAVSGNQPTKSATSFNSAYPGVVFSTDDYLLLASIPTGWPTGANAVELWAVVDQKSLVADATARVFFTYGGGTSTNTVQVRRSSVSSNNRVAILFDTATALTDLTTNFSGPHIVAGVAYGTTTEIWSDGALTATATTTLATATTRTVIGANNIATPTVFAEVGIRHLFVIAGTLTATASGEKDKLFGWAAWDSGLASLLPPAHPYKSAPP